MDKSFRTFGLCAATALAVASAHAQSSVQLFGVVDATLAYGMASGTGSASRLQLTNSGNLTSRIGFRGTEDLGGGLFAGFWLEAGLVNDDGQGTASNSNNQPIGSGSGVLPSVPGRQGLLFSRRSTVQFGGNWGEVRVGRDFLGHFHNYIGFDPFGALGVAGNTLFYGIALASPTSTRASNSFGYHLPKNSLGLYGQATVYLGENQKGVTNENDGNGYSARIGYTNGKLNTAIAFTKTKLGTGDIEQDNAGISYDFGHIMLYGLASFDKVGTLEGKGVNLGVSAPLGNGRVQATAGRYSTTAAGSPENEKVGVGYVYNFSKRTVAYVSYAHLSNSNGANLTLNGALAGGPNRSSRGLDIGYRHSF